MTNQFPFYDLHSFKDYVGFVALCSPDLFPDREGVSLGEKWSLKLAFEGLPYGMDMITLEKGKMSAFWRCRVLIDEAGQLYKAGNLRGGYERLAEVKQRLARIHTE